MPFELLLIGGVLVGSLSPLLTFARLFQMKEWRLDRLLEHLRREGWFGSLIGIANCVIVLLYTAAVGVMLGMMRATTDGGGPAFFLFISFLTTLPYWLGTYALVTALKIVLRKQRYPRWTSKSVLLVATSLMLTAFVAVGCMFQIRFLFLPYLPALQPVFLLVAWLLWKPVDFFLKQRLLSRAAARRATFKDATVIGIVGSVGKTTTKDLLKCVLQDLNPLTTPEHVNTELGVASWLLKILDHGEVRAQHAAPQLYIVEMGAYRKGEITTLCGVAQPTIAVVTALGSDHLALFGSEQAIVDANAEILDALPTDGHVFLLGDNAASAGLGQRARCAITIAGSSDGENLRESDRGLTFESKGTRFTVALHGLHNVGNAMLAITVARHLGIKDERIRELLAGFRGSAHTFHLRTERGIAILDDTYNISPLSFRAALAWAKDRPERPRVLLTSGLLETGTQEDAFMTELGKAAKTSIERAVFTTTSGRDAFANAFGKPAELLSDASAVPEDSLLICVGRMPLSAIQTLLP